MRAREVWSRLIYFFSSIVLSQKLRFSPSSLFANIQVGLLCLENVNMHVEIQTGGKPSMGPSDKITNYLGSMTSALDSFSIHQFPHLLPLLRHHDPIPMKT